jgi:hypothetical protein
MTKLKRSFHQDATWDPVPGKRYEKAFVFTASIPFKVTIILNKVFFEYPENVAFNLFLDRI